MNTAVTTNSVPNNRAGSASATALRIGLFGTMTYALLAFGLVLKTEYAPYGTDLYDAYYLALLDGRLDLPAIILRYEGHYLPDGTGYLYHGVAPLLTRFLFGWFLPLESISMAPFSIWLWASIGTALYHSAFHRLIVHTNPRAKEGSTWPIVLALMCWFAAPGLLIASNTALYHEPIAIAFAATGAYFYAFTAARKFGLSWLKALLIMSVMAAICVHSRPNLAVGLYGGIVLLAAYLFFSDWKKHSLAIVLSMGILGSSGLGYLALNEAKFGDAGVTHGSFTQSDIQYGTTFWGGETANTSERARAFVEHGRFNIKRILPNLTMYAADPPFFAISETTATSIADRFHAWTEPSLGFIRVEGPRIGFVFLWAGWIAFALYGLSRRERWKQLPEHLPLVAATGAAALLTFAYATITLRYRVDIWPMMAAAVLIALPVVASDLSKFVQGWRRLALIGLVLISVQSTVLTAMSYRHNFTEHPGSFFAPWSETQCAKRALAKGLDETRAQTICTR